MGCWLFLRAAGPIGRARLPCKRPAALHAPGCLARSPASTRGNPRASSASKDPEAAACCRLAGSIAAGPWPMPWAPAWLPTLLVPTAAPVVPSADGPLPGGLCRRGSTLADAAARLVGTAGGLAMAAASSASSSPAVAVSGTCRTSATQQKSPASTTW